MICDLMGCAAIQCKRASLVLCDSFPGEPVWTLCAVHCVSNDERRLPTPTSAICSVERGPPSKNNRAAEYALPYKRQLTADSSDNEAIP